MMEEHKYRRLKKLCQTQSDLEEIFSKPDPEIILVENESDDSVSSDFEPSDLKKKAKPAKNKAPKLPVFNKLLDLKPFSEEIVEEFEYLRDAPLKLDSNIAREKRTSFLTKIKKTKQDTATYSLAKSVLTNSSDHDNLIVEAPVRVEGFFAKTHTVNPRDVFIGSLKTEINNRKTTHIDEKTIFEKPKTDFEKNDVRAILAKKNVEILNKKKKQKTSAEEISEPVLSKETKDAGENAGRNKSYPSTSASSPVYMPREKAVVSLIENEAEISGEERSEDTSEEGMDDNLEEIIDDKKIDENKEKIYIKHINDMLEKEYDGLKAVANAQFKRKAVQEETRIEKKIKTSERYGKTLETKEKTKPKEDDESDEERRFSIMKKIRGIRSIRNMQEKSFVIDEKSTSFLKMMEKPEKTVTVKTLLNADLSKAPVFESSGPCHAFRIKNQESEIKNEAKPEKKKEIPRLFKYFK